MEIFLNGVQSVHLKWVLSIEIYHLGLKIQIMSLEIILFLILSNDSRFQMNYQVHDYGLLV